MKNKTSKKFLPITLIVIISCLFTSLNSLCVIEPTNVTVSFAQGDTVFANKEARIYQIATLDKNNSLVILPNFANLPIDFENEYDDNQYSLSQTISAYIANGKLPPTKIMKTDENGKIIIENMQAGMFFIDIERVEINGDSYVGQPIVIKIEDGMGNTDIVGKFAVYTKPEVGGFSKKTVIKSWNDNNDTSKRPISVTVSLLKDSKVYDTVVLNEENNWQYSWFNLDNKSNWQIVELDVDGDYTVLVKNESYIFELENKLIEKKEEETTTTQTSTTTSQNLTSTTNPTSTKSTTNSTSTTKQTTTTNQSNKTTTQVITTKEDELPKTGLMRAPISILATVGIFSMLVGICLVKKQSGELDA